MSDMTKNFTLRLSEADHDALGMLAARLGLDRTGTLRLLIRRAVPRWSMRETAYFVPLVHGGGVSSHPLLIRSKLKGG